MKKLVFILLISFVSFKVVGQVSDSSKFKPTFWEIGWVSSDIFIGALSGDIVLGFRHNQGIGIRTTLTQDYFFSDNLYGLYENSNFVYRGGIFHKIYLDHRRNRKITLRHGPRIRYSEYSYQKEDWIEFENLGNTQFRYGTVNLQDRNLELGYELMIGLQQRYNNLFFLEYYVGLSYMDFVSTNSTQFTLDDFRNNGSSDYGYYSGILPNQAQLVLGLVIGFRK